MVRTRIVEWRIQTLKVAEYLHDQRLPLLCRDLEDQIREKHHRIVRREDTSLDLSLQIFGKLAFRLAKLIRASKAEYIWSQLASAGHFVDSDVDWIDGFDVSANRPTHQTLAKELFGPVYKTVDGERVLLRRGTVSRR